MKISCDNEIKWEKQYEKKTSSRALTSFALDISVPGEFLSTSFQLSNL